MMIGWPAAHSARADHSLLVAHARHRRAAKKSRRCRPKAFAEFVTDLARMALSAPKSHSDKERRDGAVDDPTPRECGRRRHTLWYDGQRAAFDHHPTSKVSSTICACAPGWDRSEEALC